MSKSVYLCDERFLLKPKATQAFALRQGLGLETLTSLDVSNHYVDNLEKAREIYENVMPRLAQTGLNGLCQKSGLQGIAMERVIYHDCLTGLMQAVDLARRIERYLEQHDISHLHYLGQNSWKQSLLYALCKQRNIVFSCHQNVRARLHGVLSRFKSRLIGLHNLLLPADDLNEDCDFLFFASNARLTRGLLPIIREIGKDSVVQVVENSHENAGEGVDTAYLQSFTAWSLYASIMPEVKAILSDVDWHSVSGNIPALAVHRIILDCLQDAFAWVGCVYRVLAICPKAVVAGVFVNEPVMEVARSINRKTAVIQTIGTVEYDVHLAGNSTYLLASMKDRDRLLMKGVPADNIVICGHPLYDDPDRLLNKEQVAAVRHRYGVMDGDKLIVFAGSYSVPGWIEWESIAEYTTMFFDGVSGLRRIRIVMKLHPYEHRIEDYKSMLCDKGVKDICTITQRANINHLVQAADAVVTLGSTVGQESITLDKPLLDFPVISDWHGFHKHGAALRAYNADEVRNCISRMLYDVDLQRELHAGRQDYLADYFPVQDGRVVSRMCAALRGLRQGE